MSYAGDILDGFVFKGQLGLIAHIEETAIPVYTWLPGAGSAPPSRQGLAPGLGLGPGQQSPDPHQSTYPSPAHHSYPSPGTSPGQSPDTRRNLFHGEGEAAGNGAVVGSNLQQLQIPSTGVPAPIHFDPTNGLSPAPGPSAGLQQPSLTSSAQSVIILTSHAKPVRDTLSLSSATPPATLLRISTIKVDLFRDPTRPFRRCSLSYPCHIPVTLLSHPDLCPFEVALVLLQMALFSPIIHPF